MTLLTPAGERELLEAGAGELGIALSTAQTDQLLGFVDLIYVWNRTAGLTTVPRADAVRLHLLDSLAALPAIDASPCLDLGSGAGLPGMVLAIASPRTQCVLVESNRRRCSFLLEARRRIGLGNVEVIESDVVNLPETPKYPVVISRAFRSPAEYLRLARSLVTGGGRVVVLTVDPDASELADMQRGSGLDLEDCARLILPGGKERRAILSFRAP